MTTPAPEPKHSPFGAAPVTSQSGRTGEAELDLDNSPARESIGFLLKRVAQKLHLQVEEQLGELGMDSIRQFGILAMSEHFGPVTQQQLAATMCVDRSTMVGLIDGMERQGWVERHPDENDRRAYRIHVTEPGLALLRSSETVMHRVEDEFLRDLSTEQRSQLKTLLQQLVTPGHQGLSGFDPIAPAARRRRGGP